MSRAKVPVMSEEEVKLVLEGVAVEDPRWRAMVAVVAQHAAVWEERALGEGVDALGRAYAAGAAFGLGRVLDGLEGLRGKR